MIPLDPVSQCALFAVFSAGIMELHIRAARRWSAAMWFLIACFWLVWAAGLALA